MSMSDRLAELDDLTAEAGDVQYEAVSSGNYDADPDVIGFLAENEVYAAAVDRAHERAGDGTWTVVGLDVPQSLAEDLAPKFQKALKASRSERDETNHYRWDVRLSPGVKRGHSRIRFKANMWTDAQLRTEAARLAKVREHRHPQAPPKKTPASRPRRTR